MVFRIRMASPRLRGHVRTPPRLCSRKREHGAHQVMRAGALTCMLWLASTGTAARAIPPSIVEAVPADVVAVVFASPPADADSKSPPGTALALTGFLADQAHRLGLLSRIDATSRMWIDGLAAFSVVLEHPHAVVLFDIAATPRTDGGHQLAGLRAALVVHTGRANAGVEGRIQHLLNTYTNENQTELSTTPGSAGKVFRLRDRRLPDWAVLSWGAVDGYYIVAIGDGAFPRMAEAIARRAPRLNDDDWFAAAFKRANGLDASVAWQINIGRLRAAADTLLVRKIDGVLGALELRGATRGLWTIGWKGRSIEAVGLVRRKQRDDLLLHAGARFERMLEPNLIPDAASGFAVINHHPRIVLDGAEKAYLASQSPGDREGVDGFWRAIEREAGLSIDKDLYAHLTRPIVIHNAPRHALNLPLAWTILLHTDGGTDTLRANLDRLLEPVRRRLADQGLLRLQRDPDGVWYLQFGLLGPAVKVIDDWVVVSFSPQAVRENATRLTKKAPTPADPKQPGE